MGRKADRLNDYRKEVKAGTYKGTFNEYSYGEFSERGGATAARLESKAIAEAGAELSAQIRAVGGDPSSMSLEEMRILDANFRAAINAGEADFAKVPSWYKVTAGQSIDDIASDIGATPEQIAAVNPSAFQRTARSQQVFGQGTDMSVFAGQTLNVPSSDPGPDPFARTPKSSELFGSTPTARTAGGRGTRVPTAADYAARAQAQAAAQPLAPQRRATLTPTPNIPTQADFGGLARAAPGVSTAAQHPAQTSLKVAAKNYTNKNGRLSQAQIDAIYNTVNKERATGTMDEILSRNADNPDFQMDAMIDAFASPTFTAVIEALQSGVPPTYIEQKSFNALTEGPHGLGMMDKETSDFLKKYYELRPLLATQYTGQGVNGYWYKESQDPSDTTAGSGAGGTGGSVRTVSTQNTTRSINRMISGITPSPGGGGGSGGGSTSKPRGTGSTSSGFTPTGRAIMWRI